MRIRDCSIVDPDIEEVKGNRNSRKPRIGTKIGALKLSSTASARESLLFDKVEIDADLRLPELRKGVHY